jgi:cytochrome P450
MSPAFWDRPLQFDPDRFLPERSEGRPRFAYLPFGGGPRQCIGNLLAMMEMQIVLAVVLPRFGARLVPGHAPVRIRSQGNNKPHPGLRMQLIPIPRSV